MVFSHPFTWPWKLHTKWPSQFPYSHHLHLLRSQIKPLPITVSRRKKEHREPPTTATATAMRSSYVALMVMAMTFFSLFYNFNGRCYCSCGGGGCGFSRGWEELALAFASAANGDHLKKNRKGFYSFTLDIYVYLIFDFLSIYISNLDIITIFYFKSSVNEILFR